MCVIFFLRLVLQAAAAVAASVKATALTFEV